MGCASSNPQVMEPSSGQLVLKPSPDATAWGFNSSQHVHCPSFQEADCIAQQTTLPHVPDEPPDGPPEHPLTEPSRIGEGQGDEAPAAQTSAPKGSEWDCGWRGVAPQSAVTFGDDDDDEYEMPSEQTQDSSFATNQLHNGTFDDVGSAVTSRSAPQTALGRMVPPSLARTLEASRKQGSSSDDDDVGDEDSEEEEESHNGHEQRSSALQLPL